MVSTILWFIWELPQNLAGLILRFIYNNKILKKETTKGRVFYQVTGFGVSLGRYIFWSEYRDSNNKKHEFGHSIQSRIFGPLYLLIIGIPSILRAFYSRRYFKKYNTPWENYFNSFPENWANRLGDKYF